MSLFGGLELHYDVTAYSICSWTGARVSPEHNQVWFPNKNKNVNVLYLFGGKADKVF